MLTWGQNNDNQQIVKTDIFFNHSFGLWDPQNGHFR